MNGVEALPFDTVSASGVAAVPTTVVGKDRLAGASRATVPVTVIETSVVTNLAPSETLKRAPVRPPPSAASQPGVQRKTCVVASKVAPAGSASAE